MLVEEARISLITFNVDFDIISVDLKSFRDQRKVIKLGGKIDDNIYTIEADLRFKTPIYGIGLSASYSKVCNISCMRPRLPAPPGLNGLLLDYRTNEFYLYRVKCCQNASVKVRIEIPAIRYTCIEECQDNEFDSDISIPYSIAREGWKNPYDCIYHVDLLSLLLGDYFTRLYSPISLYYEEICDIIEAMSTADVGDVGVQRLKLLLKELILWGTSVEIFEYSSYDFDIVNAHFNDRRKQLYKKLLSFQYNGLGREKICIADNHMFSLYVNGRFVFDSVWLTPYIITYIVGREYCSHTIMGKVFKSMSLKRNELNRVQFDITIKYRENKLDIPLEVYVYPYIVGHGDLLDLYDLFDFEDIIGPKLGPWGQCNGQMGSDRFYKVIFPFGSIAKMHSYLAPWIHNILSEYYE